MADRIRLNRMQFYGYHGVLPEERKLGQLFAVDLELSCDLYQAGTTDQLDQTVNYAAVFDQVKEIVEGPPFMLIEALAENIAERVLISFSKVTKCLVKVMKPNPPIAGHYESVSAEIERSRTTAYLGLGSNIGNRESYLERALETLQAEQKIRVVHCSSIYETEPYGPVRQPDFLNMVAQVETFFPPLPFLRKLQEIETALSRAREVHWGPRTIDLDLLVFGQKVTCSEALSLPHPEIARRAFVLKPLVEIAPHLVVPGLHRSVMDLWQNLNGGEDVQLWRTNNGGGKFGLFEN